MILHAPFLSKLGCSPVMYVHIAHRRVRQGPKHDGMRRMNRSPCRGYEPSFGRFFNVVSAIECYIGL
jgi:hypothetical protein